MAFTALHFFGLSTDSTDPRFPSQGLSHLDMQQALVNIKFLAAAATVMDAVGSMPFPAERVNGASLFSVGIDHLLLNLELASVKQDWTRPHQRYTALTYDAFEQLFIILVQWIKVHESSLSMLAEAVVDTSPPSSVLLVNPMASP